MLSRLSEAQTRHLIILVMPLVITVAGLTTYATGGYRLAVVVTAVVTVALLALAWMFRPRWWGNTRVQALSLILFSGLASGILADALWLPLLARAYEQLRQSFPDLPQLVFPDALATGHKIAILIFVGLVFIVLNYIWSRYQILPPSEVVPARVAGDFPTRGYGELRDEFCEYMLRQLDTYDVDLNWSDSDYATLEAEVEMDRRGARRPRVVRDLVAAIRKDQTTRAFLVLGDPGSGKSVSLRRLCRELYGVVEETGIVPVYVNLREWNGPPQPSDEDIAAFIKKYLKGWAGRAGTRFLNEWYDRMLDHGRFFFLLDSFD
ncbi:MAG: hypothetical protein GY856_25355, partial [bacterium]|nr:hypothetical protein [bacterium]